MRPLLFIIVSTFSMAVESGEAKFSEAQSLGVRDPEKNLYISFPYKGDTLLIYADWNYLYIETSMKGKSVISSRIHVPQWEYGRVDKIALATPGWIWVSGGEIDYMVPLELEKSPPTFGTPMQLPELYTKPCSLWKRYFDECTLAKSELNVLTREVYIQGHTANLFGSEEWKAYNVIGRDIKPASH